MPIAAEYIGLKFIPTRQVVQITLEVDASMSDMLYKQLGFPASHHSKYVNVELLSDELTDVVDRMDIDASKDMPKEKHWTEE